MPIDNDCKVTGLNSPIPSGLIFLIWLLIIFAWSGQGYLRKSYSEFIQQVESGQVVKATIFQRKGYANDNQEIQYERINHGQSLDWSQRRSPKSYRFSRLATWLQTGEI